MVAWDDQILDNQLHDTESLGAVGYVWNRRYDWWSLELVVIAGGLGEEESKSLGGSG